MFGGKAKIALLLSVLSVATMLCNQFGFHLLVSADQPVTVSFNGKKLEFPGQQPVVINESVIIPMRVICEEFGADWEVDEGERNFVITWGGVIIVLPLEGFTAKISGVDSKEVTFEIPTQLINGRFMASPDIIAEAFGAVVDWNEQTRTVLIKSTLIPQIKAEDRLVENNDIRIKYTGTWRHRRAWTSDETTYFELFRNKSFSSGDTAGSTAELKFTGTGIILHVYTSRSRGLADIYIDGELDSTIDTYNTANLVEKYEKTGLPKGKHSIKVVVKGERNPLSTGISLGIDYFEIIG